MTAYAEKFNAGVESLVADLELINADDIDAGAIFRTNVFQALQQIDSHADREVYIQKYMEAAKGYHEHIAINEPEALEPDIWTEVVGDFCDNIEYGLQNGVTPEVAWEWIAQFEDQLTLQIADFAQNPATFDAICEDLVELKASLQ